jgi:hypothetical protein
MTVMTRLCSLPLTLVVWIAILLCSKTNTCSAFAPSSNAFQTRTCPLKFWMAATLNDSSNEPVQVRCPNCDQCDGSGRSVEIGNLVLVCMRCQLIFLIPYQNTDDFIHPVFVNIFCINNSELPVVSVQFYRGYQSRHIDLAPILLTMVVHMKGRDKV